MIEFLLYSISFTKVYVLVTLLFVISHKIEKETHQFLLILLCVNFFTELMNSILLFNHKTIGMTATISVILHHGLWLWFLGKRCGREKAINLILVAFLTYALTNLFFIEGMEAFNYNTFISGAFLYLVIFIYESFKRLKLEDFSFFMSNNFLLLASPILFFFGFSFVFAFKSKLLAYTIVFADIGLYTFIVYFVNIVYYTLINVFVFREKQLKQ